jgi:hypothetical protein
MFRSLALLLLLPSIVNAQALSPLAPPIAVAKPARAVPPPPAAALPAPVFFSPPTIPLSAPRPVLGRASSWTPPPPPAKSRRDWWLVGALALYAAGSAADARETYEADQRGEVIELNPLLRSQFSDRPDMKRVVGFKVGFGVAALLLHRWRPREAKIALVSGGVWGIGAAVSNSRQNRP